MDVGETPDRPRLLVLASTYPRWAADPEPGFVHALCQRLSANFEVHVICPHAPGALIEERLDGVRVHRFRYAPARLETLVQGGGILNNLKHQPWKWLLVAPFLAGLTLNTWRMLHRPRPARVHAHWIIPQGLVLATLGLFMQRPPPFLLTIHGGDLFGLRGPLMEALKRQVLRRAAALTVVSRPMVDEVLRLGADPARVHVLPMGVDFDTRFTPGPAEARLKGEILFVGRLVEKKGLRHLIAALPGIIARVSEARLGIAGFGPEETALRAQVAALGLTDRVRFLGALPQAELPAQYRRASVFVAPFVQAASGDQEGLPVALMEAIACGCPVLAGDLAVLDDLFTPAEADLRVDPTQTDHFASRVAEILEDQAGALARAQVMRQRLATSLGWDGIAGEYARLLQGLSQA